MINKFLIFFTFFISAALLFLSCDDEPTAVGVNLIPNQDIIDMLSINSRDGGFSQTSKYYEDSLSLNSSRQVLLGKHSNVESTMLLKFIFFLPDSITAAINEDKLIVQSSWIEMYPNYTFGESTNQFDFSVHKINSSWSSLTFNKDSLASLDYNVDNLSSNQNITDTIITFNFDKTVTEEWLQLAAQENQSENDGVYYKHSATTDKILGFPALTASTSSNITRLMVLVEVPGEFTDTVVAPATSDVHVVLGTLPVGKSENIFLQGGLASRANLWIDVSSIPNEAIINEAALYLYYDSTETIMGSVPSDSIGALILEDSTNNELNTSFPPVFLRKIDSFYQGNVTRFIQGWISGTAKNEGVQLYLTSEIPTVNKLAVRGSNTSDSTLKPYLEIIYTKKR